MLVRVTVSAAHPSRLALNLSDHHPALTNACALLCGHVGAPELLELAALPPGQHGLLVHLWYLIGFQNRVLVLIRWSFSFATHGRGARLITGASTNSEQR